jgi:hypothetical protein
MKKSNMRKIVIPEWTEELPDTAKLTSKDVLKIFGYSTKGSITSYIQGEYVPKPDEKVKRKGRIPKYHWCLGTLRAIANNQDVE